MPPTNAPESVPSAACRLRDVVTLTGLSRSTIYGRLCKKSPYYDPSFPRPFPLFGGTQRRGAKGWRLLDVQAWLDAQAAKR